MEIESRLTIPRQKSGVGQKQGKRGYLNWRYSNIGAGSIRWKSRRRQKSNTHSGSLGSRLSVQRKEAAKGHPPASGAADNLGARGANGLGHWLADCLAQLLRFCWIPLPTYGLCDGICVGQAVLLHRHPCRPVRIEWVGTSTGTTGLLFL